MGRGGKRPGAGRKRKSPSVNEKPARVLRHPSVPAAPPVGPVDPPEGMTEADLQVWATQAPHAIEAGTLTAATALAFATYCKVVVMESAERGGGSTHQGLIRTKAALEHRFLLTADAKPMAIGVPEAPPASKLTRFR